MTIMVWLLLFGAAFYFMLRDDGANHMMHSHSGLSHIGEIPLHPHAPKKPHPVVDAIDPVCGKTVPVAMAYSRMFGNTEYLFCSPSCLSHFDADPLEYVSVRNAS
jgi:YHS domain-containing protein